MRSAVCNSFPILDCKKLHSKKKTVKRKTQSVGLSFAAFVSQVCVVFPVCSSVQAPRESLDSDVVGATPVLCCTEARAPLLSREGTGFS